MMLRFLIVCAVAVLAPLANAASFRYQAPSYSTYPATAVATTASPGITIPAGYVGFSVEAQDLISGFFQGNNGTWNSVASASSFIGMANLLGANGSFRIGGGSCSLVTSPALTQLIATNLGVFLTALGAGWTKPIYCLDVFANNAALAATQAGYLATTFGAANVSLALNNEPISTGEFTIAGYQAAWNAYYSTINGSVAGAVYSSWDDYSYGNTQTVINGLTPGVSGLNAVTYHWYNSNGLLTTPADFINSTANFSQWNNNTSWAGSTPQRLSETNSVNHGGVNGLSNGLISATWFINQAVKLIPLGYAGVNIHMFFGSESAGKTQGIYNPMVLNSDQTFSPGAIFYGMYLVSKLQGQRLIPLAVSTTSITGLASLGGGGNANILIVNNSQTSFASVTVSQDAAWTTAKQIVLSGTSCYDTAPKLAGLPIGPSGAWLGASATISAGQPTVIPPCGAALVQIQP